MQEKAGWPFSKITRQLRGTRIQTRLTALILVVTIPLLIAVTAYISSSAGSKIETDANNHLKQTNDALVSNMASWLEQNVLSLQEMVLQPDIVSMQADRQRPVLQAMAQTHSYMYLVSTTDLTGLNVARNDNAAPTNYSDRVWFQEAKSGAPLTYQSLIGKTSGQPALVISVPIKNPNGEIVGTGMFAANLTSLSTAIQVNKIGQTGYNFIVDANNMVLAHPDTTFTTKTLHDFSKYPPVVALLQGKTGLITFTDDKGIRWHSYVSRLDNGWGIITQQQESEILAPARQFQNVAFGLILLGAVVMLVLSWFTIRRTLQPISTLTDTVSAIAAGDLNRRVEVKSHDEIGMLAATFNQMTAQLSAMIGTLEQRVLDRTHDLEIAADVGRTITEKVANRNEMLSAAVEMIRARFNLYYTQVYLTDPSGKILVLRAGTGTQGKELLERGHRLPITSGSLNGLAATDRKAVIVADTSLSATFLPNPVLPNTRSEMAIPLIAGDQVIGVLDMQSDLPDALNESNLPAFEGLTGQLAVAIQNAGLFAQTQEARHQIEADIRRGTEGGWQDFLNSIDHGERIGYLYNQNETIAMQEFGETPLQPSLAVPITITGAQVGKIETVEGDRSLTPQDVELIEATVVRLGQHLDSLRLLAQADHYRAEAEQAVRQLTRQGWETYQKTRKESASGFVYDRNQVKLLDGQILGDSTGALKRSLMVRDQAIGELEVGGDTHTEADTELIAAVANQLSTYIENLRLFEQNEERAHEMETVAELSATTSTLLDPDRLLQTIVDLTKERFGVYHAHIYLANESRQTLVLAAGAGEVGRELVAQKHAIAVDAEKSLVARSARERQAVIVNDVRADPAFLPNPLLPDTGSEMAVPLIVGDKVLGVFDVQSDRVNGFSSEDASIYTTLAAQVAVALQNARLYVEQAATVTQLRELDRLKSSFLANMSHELRTPLNSILGFSDVMLEELDGPLTETMNNDLTLIQKNGQHLLHLINDVLDMAKIEAGRMNLAPEKFELHEVLNDVVSITSTLATEKNLAVLIEKESDQDVQIFADRTRLRQVMINLVNNSIKFTEKGKVIIRTRLQEGEKALIAVKDTGIGIPPDKLETIFQEFAQIDTSSTRKAGGTGLGLPISRRLVEMHGGRLWAESTGIPGEGSTFFVELPLEARITEPIEKLEK
jgi:signal transduction histidine kinase